MLHATSIHHHQQSLQTDTLVQLLDHHNRRRFKPQTPPLPTCASQMLSPRCESNRVLSSFHICWDLFTQNDKLKDDSRKRIKDLRARLKKSDENTEKLQEQIQHQERHHASQLEQMEKELERQYATVRHLEQDNSRLRQNETSLKDQSILRQSPISLDLYYNQVDQISEAQIIRDGTPSLNSINGAIDDFVSEALEEAGSIGRSNLPIPPSDKLYHFNSSLLDLLRSQNMTEEKAGYILDAALHDFLANFLVNAFFARPVTPCLNSEHWLKNIDGLFHEIMMQGVTFL